MSRRTFVRGGGVVLGAAVAWTVPDIRTTAVADDGAGTPPPVGPQGTVATPTDPEYGPTATGDPAAVNSGRLPLTGVDPTPLIVAGGVTLAAGAALVHLAHDPQPNRADAPE